MAFLNTAPNPETWTPMDEHVFIEMAQRRERVKQAQMAPVLDIASEIISLARDALNVETMARHLAENADSIRDALAPFDSGVRVQKEV